jgi:CelD/BcsL family acetyltransferase involved in cellulose biosynthesis
VLLAWQDGRRRLVGVCAFAIRQVPQSILRMQVLTAPPWTHAYLSTPVVDRELLDATLGAMLDHVAGDAALPKIMALEAMSADSRTAHALARVLALRGSASCILGQSTRPKLASELDAKSYMENALSSASRKKLRQHRRRLAEKGVLESRIIAGPDAVGRSLEDFLVLEAAGWKGRQGTALLSDKADAAFARAMVGTLAAHGDASIHGLYLDGRPVSLQIVLRAGRAAFTWKTAYDEAWHDVSPGMLLLEDYTAAFLEDDSIDFVDSCAHDDSGFMATWSERQPTTRMWVDVRRGRSVGFTVLSRLQQGYLMAREAAKAAYLARARKRTR